MAFDSRLDEEHAPALRLEPGQKIVGRIVGFDKRLGYGDREYTVLTLELDNGDVRALHCFHEVLRQELKDLQPPPRVGDLLAVRYYGSHGKAGGGTYHKYRCAVDRGEA